MDVKLCILMELLVLYSLVYFSGFLNKRLILYDFFVQLKWSGYIYKLTAVNGLSLTRVLYDNIIKNNDSHN